MVVSQPFEVHGVGSQDVEVGRVGRDVLKLFKFSDGCIVIMDSPDVHYQEIIGCRPLPMEMRIDTVFK
jgi:hypothetical protein